MIENALEKDFESIVQLNTAEVEYTSPMNYKRLVELDCISRFHWVARVRDEVAGFLLVMDHASKYSNDNFEWFHQRSSNFLYIDRIVVSKEFSGQKIGSSLYHQLIETAQQLKYESIFCEYNIEPLNKASQAFHDHFGFKEIGTLYQPQANKRVSMQCLQLL